jgi:RNA polymerase sigma-70 factor, ECF subfamily
MNSLEEGVLIDQALLGSEDAFRKLYLDNNRMVLSVLVRLTHNQEDAEDLMTETFLSVFRNLSRFRKESKFSTWVSRIAINLFLMQIRKKKQIFVPLLDVDVYVEGDVYRRVLISEVMDKIDELPKIARSLIVLRAIYGFTNDEAAKHLELMPTTSKAYLHRTRKKVKKLCLMN